MKKVFRIVENDTRRPIKEGDNERDIIEEAERIWENRKEVKSDGEMVRLEVLEVVENDDGTINSEKIVWLSEWYDAMLEFGGGIAAEYEAEVTVMEKPRYCKIGPYEFYQAYGIDYNGKRYLIEWAIDEDLTEEYPDRPLNLPFPENVFQLSGYDTFPQEPPKFL